MKLRLLNFIAMRMALVELGHIYFILIFKKTTTDSYDNIMDICLANE